MNYYEFFKGVRYASREQARSDFELVKRMLDTLSTAGVPLADIRKLAMSSLVDSSWKERIIDWFFDRDMFWSKRNEKERVRRERVYARRQERWERQRQERARWREERERYYEQYRNQYNYHNGNSYRQQSQVGLSSALRFFGFDSLPCADDLKRKYRQMALRLHPDKGGTTSGFQEFQAHYESIKQALGI